jgi:tRNA (Thr-GGU) A37 N-methylase
MEIRFKPIGVIHTGASDLEVKEKGDCEGEIEIFPEFADGLDGIDGYSHMFVLVYFDRLRPEQIGPLRVKPRGLVRRGFKLEDLPGSGFSPSTRRPGPIQSGSRWCA